MLLYWTETDHFNATADSLGGASKRWRNARAASTQVDLLAVPTGGVHLLRRQE